MPDSRSTTSPPRTSTLHFSDLSCLPAHTLAHLRFLRPLTAGGLKLTLKSGIPGDRASSVAAHTTSVASGERPTSSQISVFACADRTLTRDKRAPANRLTIVANAHRLATKSKVLGSNLVSECAGMR